MVQTSSQLAFIGRATELARLGEALASARAGRGRVVVVGGEAGIGKTRLIERFTQSLGQDCRVITGACVELSVGELPLAPFVEGLRELVRSIPPERRPALLGPGRADLERLVPELASRAPTERAIRVEPDPMAQTRLFEVVLGVLERIAAETPVLMVIEDVQWADRSSLGLLGFLGRALRDDRVLIVMSLRPEGLQQRAPVLSALAELERMDHVDRIDLAPLDRDEVAELVASLGMEAHPDLVDALAERTDGNPFFVEELVGLGLRAGSTARSDGLSMALHDVLAARVEGLDDPDQEVLRAAAAAARRIDDTLLAAALERPARDVAAALRRIVDAGILVRDGRHGGFRFQHTLLREFVYAELFKGERIRLHKAIANELDVLLESGDVSVAAAEVAHHREASGDLGRAIVANVTAAREAEQVYANVEAHRLYERVLSLWREVPDADALVGVGRLGVAERAAETAMLAGQGARAVELVRQILAEPEVAADPLRAGLLNERLRWFLWESGDRAAAAQAVREGIRLIPADPPSAARARILAHLAGLELFAQDYAGSRDHATAAVEMARSLGARSEEALGLGILGWTEAVLGDIDGGLARFREGQLIAAELESPEGQAIATINLVSLLDRVGRPADSLAAAEDGLRTVRALGVERTYGGVLSGFAVKALVAIGRWDDAESAATEGLRLAVNERSILWLLTNRARLRTGRGRFAEAAADLDRARGIDESLGRTEFTTNILAVAAETAIWQGRISDVRSVIDTVSATPDRSGPADPSLAWIAALGLRAEADAAAMARARQDEAGLAIARGRASRIVAAIDSARADATTSAVLGSSRGKALFGLCQAEARRVEKADLPTDWAAIAEAWAEAGRPLPEAYARFREAEAILSGRGERAAADRALRSASAIANQLGASPLIRDIGVLARHARIDLQAGADRPGSAPAESNAMDPAAGFGFTEREREVLSLVAGGWSNQQIGDALFISRKTASVHVSNILGKLGVHTRVEAAAIAHRLGIGGDAPEPPERPESPRRA